MTKQKGLISRGKDYYMNKTTAGKLTILLIGVVFCIGSVSAVWLLYYNGTTGYTIISDSPMTFQSGFETTLVNTTNSSVEKGETIEIWNGNGVIDLVVSINTTFEDVADSCNYDDDCVAIYSYEGVEIVDQETISVAKGTTRLDVNSTCEIRSCPGTFETDITLAVA